MILFIFRVPNPDTVLVIQSPLGVFSTKSMLQEKGKKYAHRRSILLPAHPSPEASPPSLSSSSTLASCARCREYGKINAKVNVSARCFVCIVTVIVMLFLAFNYYKFRRQARQKK